MSDTPSPLMVGIGRRLRQARKDNGWSLDYASKLAEGSDLDGNEVGYSASALGAYERAFRSPSIDVLFDLASFYGVSVSWLLDLEEDKRPPVVTADNDYLRGAVQALIATVTGDQT